MPRTITPLLALAGVSMLVSCDRRSARAPEPSEIEDVVRTTTAPIGWMTGAVASDLVLVEMLCPDDQLPAIWRPNAEMIQTYQRAKLIVMNGAEFEAWAQTAPLPRSRVVSTADAIEGPLLVVSGETHSHGPEGEHAHEEIDGHTWLDPINAIAQAGAISEALREAFPDHANEFEANRAALASRFEALHARLTAIDTSSVEIIASESPFGYLARRYDWPTGRIGGDPSSWPNELDTVQRRSSSGEPVAAVLLCEELPDAETAEMLLDRLGVVAVLWDTGELAGDRSYIDVVSDNIDRLETAVADLAQR
ncbi:MAG: metal ABC transporter substrate-binding protein [Planctomycetota bacterium]